MLLITHYATAIVVFQCLCSTNRGVENAAIDCARWRHCLCSLLVVGVSECVHGVGRGIEKGNDEGLCGVGKGNWRNVDEGLSGVGKDAKKGPEEAFVLMRRLV